MCCVCAFVCVAVVSVLFGVLIVHPRRCSPNTPSPLCLWPADFIDQVVKALMSERKAERKKSRVAFPLCFMCVYDCGCDCESTKG